MHVPTADIYVTFRCNMRCRHCFVGPALDRGTDLPRDALIGFLRTAWSDWSTREISFLGGEPTLHPDIDLAVRAGREIGFRIRVVSNGGPALLRMMPLRIVRPASALPPAHPSGDGGTPRRVLRSILDRPRPTHAPPAGGQQPQV
ncbi:molybdenum cofactor biosynthesis protein A [Micromonospora sp. MW-13]|uniref:radical SAM protein n=1 Tax=Micromonospora sp. MW-13 TaxID=2094022 RepID=UPI000E439DA8|nr:radical SAM protein [Micromonospora sp. MW-13]RGC65419.1 molybdenum cofactor biosynthesis protein A [Micromonospora sp. MW-13]